MKKEVLRFTCVSVQDYKLGSLTDATFCLYEGETVAAAGLLNSGKKTLLSLLQGKLPNYQGQIAVNGLPVRLHSLMDVHRAGIVTIGGAALFFENLSIEDNISIMQQGKRLFSLFHKRLDDESAALLWDALDIDGVLKNSRALTVFEKKKIEIVKAYAGGARIMVFTDMTSYCGEKESGELSAVLSLLNLLKVTVVLEYDAYFKHFSEKVQRCIVFRHGMVTTTLYREQGASFMEDTINHVMVGRVFAKHNPRLTAYKKSHTHGLELAIISKADGRQIHLSGGTIAGLHEAAERIPRTLEAFAAAVNERYRLLLNGQMLTCESVRDWVNNRIAVISKESSEMLVCENLSPVENVALLAGQVFGKPFMYDKDMASYIFHHTLEKYPILKHCKNLHRHQNCQGLTQQQLYEIMLAKWLAINPYVVIMFAPFDDFDPKNMERYRVLQNDLAHAGKIVLIISSNLDELESNYSLVVPLPW